MAATTYDSDSSGPDDEDYTETNVLLGYASREATDSDDPTNHLGGQPSWLDPAIPPSAALARCKVCRDLMVLLLQLNGDLPEQFPGHERRVYVLTCRRKTCRRKDGSVRALRGVRTSTPLIEKRLSGNWEVDSKSAVPRSQLNGTETATTNIGESLFGVKSTASSTSSNPFSSMTSSAATTTTTTNPFLNPKLPGTVSQSPPQSESAAASSQTAATNFNLPQTFASALILNNSPVAPGPVPPAEPWPSESTFPYPYPLYYLVDADYETLDKVATSTPIPRRTIDIDDEGGSTNQKEDRDTYESTIDKTFQKFADRLAQNPEQVIRYEFKGQPLLYSKTDAVGQLLAPSTTPSSKVITAQSTGSKIPRCQNCGGGRVFEVQLTPHAITELEAEDLSLEGMEWGTILMGVCERDCAPTGTKSGEVAYLEEWIGVQWEEVSEKA